ncbi:hypothetical protein AUJ68_00080 [Candidatus Woesearchaeota archaeon CG1_02_57_44]|nr:MAG: hypothetical protein AUJ68_00080 [Candidatus Woesearchaeota archaeon CG1_02_57_44]
MQHIKQARLSNKALMPSPGFGTWQLRGQQCTRAVKEALQVGYRHIDTAEVYENEKAVGQGIQDFPREQLFLTSKVFHGNLREKSVLAACSASLQRLGTNYLDLYLIHWPDMSVPLAETLRAMKSLRSSDKIRAFGVSNFTIAHLREALQQCDDSLPLCCNQVELHVGLWQKELVDFCKEQGIAVTAYSPLGRATILPDPTIRKIAQRRGCSPAQVCLAWLMHHGSVPLPKASSMGHMKENLEASQIALDETDMQALDALGNCERIIDPGFAEFDKV